MNIFNKGQRQIQFDGGVLLPNQNHVFKDRAQAEKLLKLFGDELMDISNQQSAESENASLKALEAENAALKKSLEKLQADFDALKAEKENKPEELDNKKAPKKADK